MKTLKLRTALALLFSIICYSYCQVPSTNNEEESFNWDFSLKSGITNQFTNNMPNSITLSYIEYGMGYLITPNHEAGIKIGKNDFIGSEFGITEFRVSDTAIFYGYKTVAKNSLWVALYYKFNSHLYFGEILVGATGTSGTRGYTGFSAGKEFLISKHAFVTAGLIYTLTSNDFLNYETIYDNQLTLTLGFSFKL